MGNYDTYKQMLEEQEIAINNDQVSVWERKWFNEKKTSLDKALEILNNIESKTLFEVMLEKNNIRFDRSDSRKN